MPPGETVVIYEARGWWHEAPIRVHVLLPEGKRIDTEVSYVALDSYGAPCWKRTATSSPTTMDISVGPVPLDDGYREMVEAADEFELPRQARHSIEEWYSESKRAVAQGDATTRIRSYVPGVKVGYLGVGVQGRFLPYKHEVEHAFVHYTLSWAEPFDPGGCGKV